MLLNSSFHVIEAPVPDFVSVAVNVPRAELTSPFGAGTSLAAVMLATMWIVVAWLRAAAPPTAARASTTARPPASKWNLFIHSSSRHGIARRPPEGVTGGGPTWIGV